MPINGTEVQKILIVENSITQAEKLKYILQAEDHLVDWVSNAEQALKYLEDNTPDIIISDVLMPGMNGFELSKRIKQEQLLSHIPVILLSSFSEPQDIIKGLESDSDNIITKPYNKDYLLAQIQYTLNNTRLRETSKTAASEFPKMGVDIFFSGKKYRITSSQMQILDILFSTFEAYVQKNKELEEMNRQLKEKHLNIKALQGLVPICSRCKKIRDDEGYWQDVEEYLEEHSDADFNLSVCPRCAREKSKKHQSNKI